MKLAKSAACKCVLAALLLASAIAVGRSQSEAPAVHPQHDSFHVTLSGSFANPVSGRLLVFIGPASGDTAAVDMNMMSPESAASGTRSSISARQHPNLSDRVNMTGRTRDREPATGKGGKTTSEPSQKKVLKFAANLLPNGESGDLLNA